jgi:hypothetical protein
VDVVEMVLVEDWDLGLVVCSLLQVLHPRPFS